MVAISSAATSISSGSASAIGNDRLCSLEQHNVQQKNTMPEAENGDPAQNEGWECVEHYRISSGFNSEDIVTSYNAYTLQMHSDRLVATLHAANGPPVSKCVQGECPPGIS